MGDGALGTSFPDSNHFFLSFEKTEALRREEDEKARGRGGGRPCGPGPQQSAQASKQCHGCAACCGFSPPSPHEEGRQHAEAAGDSVRGQEMRAVDSNCSDHSHSRNECPSVWCWAAHRVPLPATPPWTKELSPLVRVRHPRPQPVSPGPRFEPSFGGSFHHTSPRHWY